MDVNCHKKLHLRKASTTLITENCRHFHYSPRHASRDVVPKTRARCSIAKHLLSKRFSPVLIDAFVQISFSYGVQIQIFMKYHKSRFIRKSILQR